MEKRVSLLWQGNLDFEATSADSLAVGMAGGDSAKAFRPAALMLASLAGCTGMDAVAIMLKKRVQVDRYTVEVTGQQRDEHPRSFHSIVVEHVVEGTAIDDKAVARSIELSARKYCAVGATIASGDATINHRMRIVDASGQRECDCLTIGPEGAGLVTGGGP